MRRFEMIEGSSAKFWEVDTDGADLTVTFGRIGTDGQSKTKTFDDAAKAQAEAAKLVKEKTGKGYSEMGAGATSSAPSPACAVAKPAKAKTVLAAPPVPLEEALPPPLAVAPADLSSNLLTAELAVPNEAFIFTPERLALLPVVRGINPGSYKPDISLLGGWAQHIAKLVMSGKLLANAQGLTAGWVPADAARFTTQRLALASPFWTPSETLSAMERAKLLHADATHWSEVLVHSYYAESAGNNAQSLRRGVSVCLALRGAALTLEAVLNLWQLCFPVHEYGDYKSVMFDLRSAIAGTEEAEHAAALAIAQAHFGQQLNKDGLIAYLMAHRTEFVNPTALKLAKEDASCLHDTCMDVQTYAAFIAGKRLQLWCYENRHLGTLLFIVHRFGAEQALELLMAQMALTFEASTRKALVQFIVQLRTPKLIERLVEYAADREVRPQLDRLTALYPAEAIRASIERAAAIRSKDLEQWAVRFATTQPQHVPAALAAVSPHLRAKFEAQLDALHCEAAPGSALPSILQHPPWLSKTKVASIPCVKLDTAPQAPTYHWQPVPEVGPEKNAYWVAEFDRQWRKGSMGKTTEQREHNFHLRALFELKIKSDARAGLLAGNDFKPEDLMTGGYETWRNAEPLLHLPVAIGKKLWQQMPASAWTWCSAPALIRIMATYGDDSLSAAMRVVQSKPTELIAALEHVESPLCVSIMAHAAKRLKRVRAEALRWLRRYPETSATALLPLSFDPAPKDKPLRDSAQFALRWLAQNGASTALNTVAARYGAECVAALAALLSIDPLQLLPSKLPKLPVWFTPGAYARPTLNDGRPISVEASSHIGMMIALSSLEEPYGGIEIVKEALDQSALAEFAWAVFTSWIDAGAPSKENFGFLVLGLLGNDETARRLAPKIREWPGLAAHARAVTGLDYLAAIGSDVSLMHLNAIADKAKFKGLQERAKVKIAEVAELRGFTRDELADRLVPDLGLDEDAALKLDFGPRYFMLGFDESLKPFVSDADGVRLKDLPKPVKADDQSKAEAATERFKATKKDAKAIASQQIARLEKAMVYGRHWSMTDFTLFFISHPLMQFMSRRLLWGVYLDHQFQTAFRVAEDLTFANANDDSFTPPDHCEIGIAHVIDMPESMQWQFGELFGDYTILQPFRQLAREIYALSEAELAATSLTRFASKSVATGSVMGLMSKGWERDGAEDGGWVSEFSKVLPSGLTARLRIDPGTIIGDPTHEPFQKLAELELGKIGTWDDKGKVPFSTLSRVLLSEIIRDLELLPAASKEKP